MPRRAAVKGPAPVAATKKQRPGPTAVSPTAKAKGSSKGEPCVACCVRVPTAATAPPTRRPVRCPSCHGTYHRSCYAPQQVDQAWLPASGLDAPAECLRCRLGGYDCNAAAVRALRTSESAAWRQAAPYAFRLARDGFVVVPLASGQGAKAKAALGSRLEEMRGATVRLFERLMHAYNIEHLTNDGRCPTLDEGYSNFRRRCFGRYEIIDADIAGRVAAVVDDFPLVRHVAQLAMCSGDTPHDVKQLSSGCFFAAPGAEVQNWHTDGPALVRSGDTLPYAVNVFIPLVPVSRANGTLFTPGSHRATDGTRLPNVSPAADVGSALLFDYRVVHRGMANTTTAPRPVVYTTYGRSWYTDNANFSHSRWRRVLDPGLCPPSAAERARARESREA